MFFYNYRDGKKHGQSITLDKQGNWTTGAYNQGKMHGTHIIVRLNGSQTVQQWDMSKLTKTTDIKPS